MPSPGREVRLRGISAKVQAFHRDLQSTTKSMLPVQEIVSDLAQLFALFSERLQRFERFCGQPGRLSTAFIQPEQGGVGGLGRGLVLASALAEFFAGLGDFDDL